MYMCAKGINFVFFYDISIVFWNCGIFGFSFDYLYNLTQYRHTYDINTQYMFYQYLNILNVTYKLNFTYCSLNNNFQLIVVIIIISIVEDTLIIVFKHTTAVIIWNKYTTYKYVFYLTLSHIYK